MKHSDLQHIKNTLTFLAEKGKFSNRNTEHVFREVKRCLDIVDSEIKTLSIKEGETPISTLELEKEIQELTLSIEKFTQEGHHTMASMCIGQRNALLTILEKTEK